MYSNNSVLQSNTVHCTNRPGELNRRSNTVNKSIAGSIVKPAAENSIREHKFPMLFSYHGFVWLPTHTPVSSRRQYWYLVRRHEKLMLHCKSGDSFNSHDNDLYTPKYVNRAQINGIHFAFLAPGITILAYLLESLADSEDWMWKTTHSIIIN